MPRILKFMSFLLVLVLLGCPNTPQKGTKLEKKEPDSAALPTGETVVSLNNSPAIPGRQVPDVVLTDLDGKKVSLRGLLSSSPISPAIFMFATTTCPHCHDQFADTQNVKEVFGDLVKVLTILVNETPSSAREYLENNKVPGKVLVDPEAKAADAYRVDLVPTLLVTDASKVLNYIGNYTPEKDLADLVARVQLGQRFLEVRPGSG